ncbi:MAG: hypothetical protein NT029_16375 [Armatimonadetes bacterium]|nr:hypothetical protein [Armatimonadota bacterium]
MREPAPVTLRGTLRRGFGGWWDRLGLGVAISIAGSLAVSGALGVAALTPLRVRWPILFVALTLVWAAFGFVASRMAFHALLQQEASWIESIRALRGCAARALRLSACQVAGAGLLGLGALFYATRGWSVSMPLTALCALMLAHWLAQCGYQWPLLIAAEEGIIQRPDGGRPRVRAAVRNALLLTVTQRPDLCLVQVATACVTVASAASGVGIVLIGPGLAAFLTTALALVRLSAAGLVTLPPDPSEPVRDTGWPASRDR